MLQAMPRRNFCASNFTPYPNLDALYKPQLGGMQPQILPEDIAGPAVDLVERKTSKYMTKYERARVIGTRALQLRYVPAAPSSLPPAAPSSTPVVAIVALRLQHECSAIS